MKEWKRNWKLPRVQGFRFRENQVDKTMENGFETRAT